jgi:WD40 repeat protein
VAFTTDGGTVVSASTDGTVRHWDVITHKEAGKTDGPPSLSGGPLLSADGQLVIWRMPTGSRVVWDAVTGQELAEFPGRVFPVPRTNLALVGSDDGGVALWDVATRLKQCTYYPHPESKPIVTAALSGDGKRYALSLPSVLKVGSVATLATMQQEPPPRPAPPRVTVFPTELRRFDLLPILPNTQGVTAVAFSPDGRMAVMGSTDNCLRVWDVETGRGPGTLMWKERRTVGPVAALGFLRVGQQFLSATPDGIRLWDLSFGKEVPRFEQEFTEPDVLPTAATAFSANGRLALTRSGTALRLWDIETGKVLKRFEGTNKTDSCLALSPDGKLALDGLDVWDLTSFEVLHQLEGHTAAVNSAAFSPDGRRALTASQHDGTLRLWDVESGQELHRMQTPSPTCVAFAPNGRRAVSGGADRTVRLWDLEDGKATHRFESHTDEVQSITFSPDGRRILSGSADRTMRLWQLPTP